MYFDPKRKEKEFITHSLLYELDILFYALSFGEGLGEVAVILLLCS